MKPAQDKQKILCVWLVLVFNAVEKRTFFWIWKLHVECSGLNWGRQKEWNRMKFAVVWKQKTDPLNNFHFGCLINLHFSLVEIISTNFTYPAKQWGLAHEMYHRHADIHMWHFLYLRINSQWDKFVLPLFGRYKKCHIYPHADGTFRTVVRPFLTH